MNLRIFLLGLLAGALAFAGNERGNDDVVVCKDSLNKIERLQILDYWEGEWVYHFVSNLGAPSIPVGEKIEQALRRLDRLDPERAGRYRAQAAAFFDDSLCLSGMHLPNAHDYGDIPLADNCAVDPIAFQKEPFFPEDKRYWINSDYWKLLNNDSRAGVVLHELFYREALSRGQTDSKISRYLNALLASGAIDKWSPDFYRSEMVKFGFNNAASSAGSASGEPATTEQKSIVMPVGFCEGPSQQ